LHNTHRAQVHDKQAYVFEQVKTNVFVLVMKVYFFLRTYVKQGSK